MAAIPRQREPEQDTFRVCLPEPDLEALLQELRQQGWEVLLVEEADEITPRIVTVRPAPTGAAPDPGARPATPG